jgi:hypothetical protein
MVRGMKWCQSVLLEASDEVRSRTPDASSCLVLPGSRALIIPGSRVRVPPAPPLKALVSTFDGLKLTWSHRALSQPPAPRSNGGVTPASAAVGQRVTITRQGPPEPSSHGIAPMKTVPLRTGAADRLARFSRP